jgi:hypothetical protein
MAKVYRIEKLERGERGQQTGLFVHLYNVTNDLSRKYPDFCSDYHQADAITALEEAGENAMVEINWRKNGKWINIDTVEQVNGDTPETESKSDDNPAPSKDYTKKSKSKGNDYRKPTEIIRADAFRQSKDIAIGMLSASDYSKLFPKTKTTPEILKEFTFELAEEIVDFVKGKKSGKVSSEDSDLDKKGVDAGEPDLPDDDDDDILF